MCYLGTIFYPCSPIEYVAEVFSMLNSATGTPRAAKSGAKAAAGYTTEDVPICQRINVTFS